MADRDMHDVYCESLMETAEDNPDVVVLTAVLRRQTVSSRFRTRFPTAVSTQAWPK